MVGRVGDRFMLPGLPRGPAYLRPDGRNALEVAVAGVFTAEERRCGIVRVARALRVCVRDLIGADKAGMEYIADSDSRRVKTSMLSVLDRRGVCELARPGEDLFVPRAPSRAYYGTYRELARFSILVHHHIVGHIALDRRQRDCAGATRTGQGGCRARSDRLVESRVALPSRPESAQLLFLPAVLRACRGRNAGARNRHRISLASRAWPSPQTTIAGLILAMLFVLAVSAVPIAGSVAAQIAPGCHANERGPRLCVAGRGTADNVPPRVAAGIASLVVPVVGTAGVTFILVSMLAVANGIADATRRSVGADVVIVLHRDALIEMDQQAFG